MGDLGLFIVGAEVDPDKREAAEAAILDEIARMRNEGPTEEERSKALKLSALRSARFPEQQPEASRRTSDRVGC